MLIFGFMLDVLMHVNLLALITSFNPRKKKKNILLYSPFVCSVLAPVSSGPTS